MRSAAKVGSERETWSNEERKHHNHKSVKTFRSCYINIKHIYIYIYILFCTYRYFALVSRNRCRLIWTWAVGVKYQIRTSAGHSCGGLIECLREGEHRISPQKLSVPRAGLKYLALTRRGTKTARALRLCPISPTQ